MADWKDTKPTYQELLMMISQMGKEVLKLQEDLGVLKQLKQRLQESEWRRAELAKELQELKRKTQILQQRPTPAMLQSATAFLLQQEIEAEATLKKIPMVKDPKTGKWIPR
jgi:predicted  nucleic acid-binding Zn-ribbon protein